MRSLRIADFQNSFADLVDAITQQGNLASMATPQDHSQANYYNKHVFSYQHNTLTVNCSARQAIDFLRAYTCPSPLS